MDGVPDDGRRITIDALSLCPLCQESMWHIRSRFDEGAMSLQHAFVCANRDCLRFERLTTIAVPVQLSDAHVEVRF